MPGKLPAFFSDRILAPEQALEQAVKSGTRIASGFATSEPMRFYSELWDHVKRNDVTDLRISQALFMGPHKILVGDALSAQGALGAWPERLSFLPPLAGALTKVNGLTQKLNGLELLLGHYRELRERRIRFTSAFLGPASNMIIPDNLLTRLKHPDAAGRNSSRMGVTDMHSVHFPDALNAMAYDHFMKPKLDLLVIVLTPPDENGDMSHGPANGANADVLNTILDQLDANVLVYLNPRYPFTRGFSRLPNTVNVSRFEALARANRLFVVEDDTDPPAIPQGSFDNPLPEEVKIAQHIAEHMEHHLSDTRGRALQVGIGGTGVLAIKALADSSWTGRVYTEMLEPFTLKLFEQGKITGSHFVESDGSRTQLDGKIVCTFSMGEQGSDFYQKLDHNDAVCLMPASRVVIPEAFQGGLGINNSLAIDFQGHVNASGRDQNWYSGIGGLAMINRGLGSGGIAYLCLKSTHRDLRGKLRSSIFPFLPQGTPVGLIGPDLWGGRQGSRFHLVTEHGIAELSGKCQSEFISALISVADPRFKDWLKHEAWREFRVKV